MNVCILNESFGMGGIEKVSTVIGNELKNYNVYYYSMFNNENYYNIDSELITLNSVNTKNKYLNYKNYIKKIIQSTGSEFSPAWFYKASLDKFIKWVELNEIDVVIISGPLLISTISYLKKKTNSRYIAWIHNNYNTYMNKYTVGYKRYFIDSMEKADEIVVLTQKDFNDYGQLNKNISVIYNPLTINQTRNSTLLNNNISFTARIVFEHKGIDYLIEVAKAIPADWTISIAGQGPEEKRLRDEIKLNNLENKLILLGPLNEEGLREHYLNSSLYIMTSRWEGMPLVLAEAMAFGLPILAFSQTGSNEVLENGKYGILVQNGDIKEIAKQLTLLIENIELRKHYQKLSLQRVEDFRIDKIINEWDKILLKQER